MASNVLNGALNKISQKYPQFSKEGGRKVVDTLQDAYKSYKDKKKVNSEVNSAPQENHSLITIPNDRENIPSEVNNTKRDSFYENFEEFKDYIDKNPTQEGLAQKFPTESNEIQKPQPNGLHIAPEDSKYTDPRLSDNPPVLNVNGVIPNAEGGQKEMLICEYHTIPPGCRPFVFK